MARAKIAISLEGEIVEKLDLLVGRGIYPSRSRAIQEALEERLDRLSRDRLSKECARLDPAHESAIAEEGMVSEIEQWPEY